MEKTQPLRLCCAGSLRAYRLSLFNACAGAPTPSLASLKRHAKEDLGGSNEQALMLMANMSARAVWPPVVDGQGDQKFFIRLLRGLLQGTESASPSLPIK